MVDLKKISRRTLIGGGLVAVVLAGATVVDNFRPLKRINLVDRASVKTDLNEERKKLLYDSILAYNEEFYNGTEGRGGDFEGYVDFMARGSLWQGYSNEVRKSIDYYAKENNGDREKGKEVVVKGYVGIQKICLDLAVSKLESEVSEQDINECSERLVIHMRNVAKVTPVDYQHPAVKEAYKEFAKERVDFFKGLMVNSGLTRNNGLSEKMKRARKVLDLSKDAEDKNRVYERLIRELYTEEEFGREILKYDEARKPLYESFGKSLENVRGALSIFIRTLGPMIARKTGERSSEVNRKEVGRIFDKDANQN